mgnify:CR=1 FL=1
MQVWKSRRNIGMWSVAVSLAAAFALGDVLPVLAEETTDWAAAGNRVFFRGGYARLDIDRGGQLFTDGHGAAGRNDANNGYYVGGGADLMMTKNLWGMLEGVGLAGEISAEYKRFDSAVVANADTTGVLGVSNSGLNKVQLTMLTVSIAPKVKFRQGTDFQPWVIPFGLDFLVVSPPSNQGQYVDVGVQFAGGAEYRVWKAIWLGLDARYHVAAGSTNTINNYMTAGGYVGIGF